MLGSFLQGNRWRIRKKKERKAMHKPYDLMFTLVLRDERGLLRKLRLREAVPCLVSCSQ